MIATIQPSTQVHTIADLFAALVADLAGEMPAPLLQSFTLATIAADLCALAGEPVPAAVAAALDDEPIVPWRADAYQAGYRAAGAITREAYQEPA